MTDSTPRRRKGIGFSRVTTNRANNLSRRVVVDRMATLTLLISHPPELLQLAHSPHTLQMDRLDNTEWRHQTPKASTAMLCSQNWRVRTMSS